MHPPGPLPLPLPPPAPGYLSPAVAAAALTRQLARLGVTGVYTASCDRYAVISVNASLTVWTDGRLLWCIRGGQRQSWPAADTERAASHLAASPPPAAT
jgi:hypothetical protein